MSTFPLTITSLDRARYSGEAESVTCPAVEGEVTILKGHIPLITNLKKGEIIVKTEKDSLTFQVEKGILEVSKNRVTILL